MFETLRTKIKSKRDEEVSVKKVVWAINGYIATSPLLKLLQIK